MDTFDTLTPISPTQCARCASGEKKKGSKKWKRSQTSPMVAK